MNKTVAIVVTYNRCKLLEENIEALLAQTVSCDILVIDNASTDNTAEMIKSIDDNRVLYINTGRNLGGAGGFSFGVKQALIRGYDYGWIMDDDAIPKSNALESLLNKTKVLNNKFSFLASLVYYVDGKIFPMNFVKIIDADSADTVDIISKFRVAPINDCSFVGCFVNLDVAKKTALPISDFFIYGDDLEYTSRLRKIEKAYLDFDSIIIHKAPSNIGCDVVFATSERIQRFYLQTRNSVYKARKIGINNIIKKLIELFKTIVKIIIFSKDHKCQRIKVIMTGIVEGFKFNPTLEYIDFKEHIEE